MLKIVNNKAPLRDKCLTTDIYIKTAYLNNEMISIKLDD